MSEACSLTDGVDRAAVPTREERDSTLCGVATKADAKETMELQIKTVRISHYHSIAVRIGVNPSVDL